MAVALMSCGPSGSRKRRRDGKALRTIGDLHFCMIEQSLLTRNNSCRLWRLCTYSGAALRKEQSQQRRIDQVPRESVVQLR